MLSISTLPEALVVLEKHTGRAWTNSELFDIATTHNIKLNAAAPITAQTTIQRFVIGKGLVEIFRSPPGHSLLAVLFPWQVGQLWISGETTTRHPKEQGIEGDYYWFIEPIQVTREHVRIGAGTLTKILTIWETAQSGPWIPDTSQAGGGKYHWGPNWIFPSVTPTPIPVIAPAHIRRSAAEAQNKMILEWLISEGHNPKLLPLPLQGKAGIKKECRDELCKSCKPTFSSVSVFNTAWDRLRSNKEILDA